MKNSKYKSLDWMDFAKGLMVAVFSAVLSALLAITEGGHLPDKSQVKGIVVVALTAMLSYLLKNLFTNSEGQPLKKDTPYK